MSLLLFLILVTVTWVLWAVGGTLGLYADKLEQKVPQNAGFSIAPIIPVFPLLAVVFAFAVDKFVTPWGVRIVGTFHVVLVLTFLVGIGREIHRIRSSPHR